MKTLMYIGFLLLAAILFFIIFIIYSTITYYDPQKELIIAQNSKPDTIPCNSTLNALSWNIGYAGLGENMDFFYDSGKKVRDTYERTMNNLDSITNFLHKQQSNSFLLIQEVDLHSKRSYYINEMDTILAKTHYFSTLAPNYVVKFVPIPPSSPMGQVNSGVLSLSKFLPINSIRYSYPGKFSWPNRLFNLRRCMLVNRYPTNNGKEFVLINTHMSAFDDGSLKKQEMQFLKDYVLAEYVKGNYILVGGDWNQSPPNFPLTTFGENFKADFFILTNINPEFMPNDWQWVFDQKSPTNRYLNEPYDQKKTFKSIIDIFLVSPNVEVLSNQTFDLNFQNSDHNPISICFKLRH
jgi:endonuclease/exonuclease/phosphatase family metal-dependent hydrolase